MRFACCTVLSRIPASPDLIFMPIHRNMVCMYNAEAGLPGLAVRHALAGWFADQINDCFCDAQSFIWLQCYLSVIQCGVQQLLQRIRLMTQILTALQH